MFRSAVKLVAIVAIGLVGFLFVTQSYGGAQAATPAAPAAQASSGSMEWGVVALLASGICLLLMKPRRRTTATRS